MLRAIGRLIRAQQEERIIEGATMPHVMFNIMTDVRYRSVLIATNQACDRSTAAGLGHEVLKSDVVSFAEEKAMLASDAASMDSPSSLNVR
jgi:hypothetical protein